MAWRHLSNSYYVPGFAVDIGDTTVNKSRKSPLLCTFHVVSGGWVRSVEVNMECTQMLWGNTFHQQGSAALAGEGLKGDLWERLRTAACQRAVKEVCLLEDEWCPCGWAEYREVSWEVLGAMWCRTVHLWLKACRGLRATTARCSTLAILSEAPYQLFSMGRNATQRREITKVLQALSACCRMWPPLLTEQPLYKMLSILLVDRAETVVA